MALQFEEKVFDPRKKEKLLEKVLELTQKGFKPKEIAEKIGKNQEMSIYNYQNELVAQGKLEKNEDTNRLKIYETIEGVGEYYQLTKDAFCKIQIIADYLKKKSMTTEKKSLNQIQTHISRLAVFCNTVKFNPNFILYAKDPVELLSEKMLVFRNALDSGTVKYLRPNNARIKRQGERTDHQPYARSWASLMDAIGKPLPTLPASHILNRSRKVKGAYSEISLTYNQYRKGIEFIKSKYELKYLAIYLLMVEIFPRTNAVFTNPINLELKYTEVDGKQYPYGIIKKWYEEKQTEYFTKLVLDPEVIRYIQSILESNKTVFETDIIRHKKIFNDIMRKFYIELGLLPKELLDEKGEVYAINDPRRPIFNKNTDQFYLDWDPTYTLRHTGATFSCHRTDFQTNKVSKLGWKSTDTLEKNYASIPIENLVDDSKCLYCNPPSELGHDPDFLDFCRFAHAIAWFNNGHRPKNTDQVRNS